MNAVSVKKCIIFHGVLTKVCSQQRILMTDGLKARIEAKMYEDRHFTINYRLQSYLLKFHHKYLVSHSKRFEHLWPIYCWCLIVPFSFFQDVDWFQLNEIRGRNVQLSSGRLTAKRVGSYNQGVVLTSREILKNQLFQVHKHTCWVLAVRW